MRTIYRAKATVYNLDDDHIQDDHDQDHNHDENATLIISQAQPIMDTVKPPVVHGYGTENGRRWLQKFGNYIALRRIADTEKPLYFKMFLDEPAFVWPGTLVNDVNWAQLRNSFAIHFSSDPTLLYCFCQEFDSRVQGPNESVEFYVNDFRRLGAKLNKQDAEHRDKLNSNTPPPLVPLQFVNFVND